MDWLDTLPGAFDQSPPPVLMHEQMVESARKAVPPPLSSRSAGEIPLGVRDLKGDNPNLKENSIGLFEDWLRLLSGTHPDDKVRMGTQVKAPYK